MYATILLFYLIEIQQLVGMHPGASAFICMLDAGISDAPGCIPTLIKRISSGDKDTHNIRVLYVHYRTVFVRYCTRFLKR